VIAGAVAVVAVVLLSVGGDPAETSSGKRAAAISVNAVRLSAANLYAPIDGPGVSAVIPAGWTRKPVDAEGIEDGVTAVSAQDKTSSVTLGVMGDRRSSLAAQARALRGERQKLAGYDEQSFRPQTLAGERPAWKLLYKRDGRSTVEYVTSGCDRYLAVSGTAPDKLFGTLENRFGVVARSFQAVC
jgi:hypothetical protein